MNHRRRTRIWVVLMIEVLIYSLAQETNVFSEAKLSKLSKNTRWTYTLKDSSESTKTFFPSTTTSPTTVPSISSGPTRLNEKCYNIANWYDEGGPSFNCEWYMGKDWYCEYYGYSFENFGHTATTACCGCGGGYYVTNSPSMYPTVSSMPSTSPSISLNPSYRPSLSAVPSIEPSLSMTPSSMPSVSLVPSAIPSLSLSPSSAPSVSTTPTNSPTISMAPSNQPSISMAPSSSPSISKFPSSSPSISLAPTDLFSTTPSESLSPSTSMNPSNSPSISFEPSFFPSIKNARSKAPYATPIFIGDHDSPTMIIHPSSLSDDENVLDDSSEDSIDSSVGDEDSSDDDIIGVISDYESVTKTPTQAPVWVSQDSINMNQILAAFFMLVAAALFLTIGSMISWILMYFLATARAIRNAFTLQGPIDIPQEDFV